MSGPAAEAKLVARGDRLAVAEMNLHHLLAVDPVPLFVGQSRDDLLGRGINDFAGGGVGVLAVEAEGDPAGLFAGFTLVTYFGGIAVASNT